MELFFAENFRAGQEEIMLSPDESRHASRVLRKHTGDLLDITDGRGHHIRGSITSEKAGTLTVRVESLNQIPFPAANRIEVAIAIIRPNRMDWAVEKLTELGIETIVPLITRYSIIRTVKQQHLQKIATSAMKQSNQFYLPEVSTPLLFEYWLESVHSKPGCKIIAHLQEEEADFGQRFESLTSPVFLAIGPEGGFHPEEVEMAQKHNFMILNLGATVLRSETAAVAAVARIKMLV